MITHPSTNRAQRRLTSLIETNALPLRQTATLCRRNRAACERRIGMCGYTAVLEDVLVLNFMNTFFTYVWFFLVILFCLSLFHVFFAAVLIYGE